MFVKVKDLTTLIDKNINYVNEAKESKSNFDPSVFADYMQRMTNTLKDQLTQLKRFSSSDSLIGKYELKIQKAIEQ